jgi:hypothetical protein
MNTNTPASVEGCSSCGALYEAVPGDRGVCAACRRLLPSEPPWRSGATSPAPAAAKPVGAVVKRPGVVSAERPRFRGGRVLRRIAFGAACAFLVAGLAAAIGRRTLTDAWTAVRRHTPAQAWTAIQRQASEAWIAVRRLTPFDEPQAKKGASVGSATLPSRATVRDAGTARGTRHHAQLPVRPAKAKAAAMRTRDEMNRAGSTP